MNNKINDILNALSPKLKTDKKKIEESAKSGDFSEVFKNMKPEDAQKLQHILSSKEETEKLLSTPQAQELLKILTQDDKLKK